MTNELKVKETQRVTEENTIKDYADRLRFNHVRYFRNVGFEVHNLSHACCRKCHLDTLAIFFKAVVNNRALPPFTNYQCPLCHHIGSVSFPINSVGYTEIKRRMAELEQAGEEVCTQVRSQKGGVNLQCEEGFRLYLSQRGNPRLNRN